jgi:rhodanese-related sulfurtransferase
MKSLFSILFTALLISCSAQEKADENVVMADVSNEEAKELMAQQPDLQIIDVRQNAEVANGIIDGAIQMDISKPAFDAQIETLDKEMPVLVYCAAGGRSKTAQEIMEEAGFKTVYNLKRGYERWE